MLKKETSWGWKMAEKKTSEELKINRDFKRRQEFDKKNKGIWEHAHKEASKGYADEVV